MYKGTYYAKFSCFPFYSDYVIVIQKKRPYEIESKLSMGGAYLTSKSSRGSCIEMGLKIVDDFLTAMT